MVVSFILPFFSSKWGPLWVIKSKKYYLIIHNFLRSCTILVNGDMRNETDGDYGDADKLENAVQTVEDIVEAVEKVAENVDKIAEDIADDLPQGKLRDLVEMVEHMAEKTAKTADCLDDVIDKV